MIQGPDGALYALDVHPGTVTRITYTGL